MESAEARTSVFRATALAALAHLLLDAVASRLLLTTPPYLLLDYAAGPFKDLLPLDRTTLLVVVSFISAGVNGAIAGLFATAIAGARRRVLTLGVSLSILWVFSGGLMIAVYFDPPLLVALGSLAAGVPRSFAVAWVLYRGPRRRPA